MVVDGGDDGNSEIVGKLFVKTAEEKIIWCWAEVNTWMAFMTIQ